MNKNIIDSNKNNYIQNILYIQFENISKYLDYNDYINFYNHYGPKNIEQFKRKCKYCNKIPICPITIAYPTYKKNIKCNKLMYNPICYTCSIENWMFDFNKLKFKEKLKINYQCPYKCCHIKNKLNSYNESFINFNINWKYLQKIKYYKCQLCDKVFINKSHYEIFKHHKLSYCSIILKKLKHGLQNISDASSDFSDDDSDFEL